MPPIYEYKCEACDVVFDVAKPMSESSTPEACTCGKVAVKQIARFSFSGAGDWNNQTMHPALGCYVKSDAEARKIAKSRGMEEVGNTSPEALHKYHDKVREDRREQYWNDALKD